MLGSRNNMWESYFGRKLTFQSTAVTLKKVKDSGYFFFFLGGGGGGRG